MSQKLREAVSAATDNEANEFELRRLLDEAARDPELRTAWNRQHEVSAALRGEWCGGGVDLGARLHAAIREESSARRGHRQQSAASQPFWSKLAAVAVTAGVAAAFTFALLAPPESPDVQTPLIVGEPLVEETAVQYSLQNEIPPAELKRLNAYMMHHVQHQAMFRPGVSSFTKFVTYPVESTENP